VQLIPTKIEEYDYDLPDTRVAKFPEQKRDHSNLLVYNKGVITSDQFYNLPNYLSGKVLFFNNTKVIKARLLFKRVTGATIEIFCLEPLSPFEYAKVFSSTEAVEWKCLVGNMKKWKEDELSTEVIINGESHKLSAQKVELLDEGVLIRFYWDDSKICFGQILEAAGAIPIPPYLNRKQEEIDIDRYQTVYSKWEGSVAAPTAGLHFTDSVFSNLSEKDNKFAELTLHVGAGTFKPVKAENIDEHTMHTEHFSISLSTLEMLLANNGSIVAVGTTSVRTIESIYWLGIKVLLSKTDIKELHLNQWDAYNLPDTYSSEDVLNGLIALCKKSGVSHLVGSTQIMIAPGYKFKIVNALITNFHQPRSTLLLLVSALIGYRWKDVYDYALKNNFRFLSYGDSSLLIP
jgi:S-adenosylmethionine:tRNA ribosyltransferase-isomerase